MGEDSKRKHQWKWERESHCYWLKLFDTLNISLNAKATIIEGGFLSALIELIDSMLIIGALD